VLEAPEQATPIKAKKQAKVALRTWRS